MSADPPLSSSNHEPESGGEFRVIDLPSAPSQGPRRHRSTPTALLGSEMRVSPGDSTLLTAPGTDLIDDRTGTAETLNQLA
jgi:hypothetical protein